MPLTTPALILHLLIETPASLSFLLAPAAQLPGASPDARLILRNLGGLLLATNLVCGALLAAAPHNNTEGSSNNKLTAMACLGLGTYHVWPIHRAFVRMRRGVANGKGEKKVLGGPVVHFVVHVVCLVAMVGGGVLELLGGEK